MSELMVFGIVVLMFSIVIHEYAHGWMALRCGDHTAQYAGRLTLNPIPHIDPIGTILVPAMLVFSGGGIIFGWAKPVPVNPYNFNNPAIDNVRVSAAGPVSNLILATILTFGIVIMYYVFRSQLLIDVFMFGIQINLFLALFNLIPLHPLDGSHILEYFIPRGMQESYHKVQNAGPIILLFLIMSGWIFGISILWMIIGPPMNVLYNILMGIARFFIH